MPTPVGPLGSGEHRNSVKVRLGMAPITGKDDGTTGYGVEGESPSAIGVLGVVGELREQGIPLHGSRPAAPLAGVVGHGYIVGLEPGGIAPPDSPATYGVYGSSVSGDGVYGNSGGANGVHGVTGEGSGHPNPRRAGVCGESDSTNGVYGASARWNGVEGDSWSPTHAGVAGQNNAGGPGVWGYSTGNAGQFEGNVLVSGTVTVGGDIVLQNADCAEDFDVSDNDLDAGTVVVMNEDGTVRACDAEYATTAIGIISGAGGLRPGVTLDRRPSTTPRMPVALMGKVYCKADATRSPIKTGDLLTTSKTHGHAMRAIDPDRAFGSVIGKALGGLARGRGMILVLVSLQ